MNTKQKIIYEARKLFSRHGFEGTSVRQIAEKSEVNLAAVNYHFGSKNNLYWSVIHDAFEWIEDGVKIVCKEAQSTEDLVRKLFLFLRSEEHYILSTMKTFLSCSVAKPSADHPHAEVLNRDSPGPPGGQYLFAFLKKQCPKEIHETTLQWAVMAIFSNIFHFATMCSTHHFKSCFKNNQSDAVAENCIAHNTVAIMEYLQNHRDLEMPVF